MEPTKASARDFFLHLGSIVALYVVAGNFINLLFKIINQSFPEVLNYSYSYFGNGSQISLSVATLLIVFPIFVLLSWLVHKTYENTPEKKSLAVRRWLTYITLFVAGILLAGDLVTILYKFLDGQDLTAAFLLKALTVLLVAGAVFGFYLQDIRDRVSARSRKLWATVVGVIIIISIILGFSVLGSPQTQRLLRYDNQKVMDLQNLQWQVINYWQMNGSIPSTMPNMPLEMEYKKTGNMTFELCANFNRASMMQPRINSAPLEGPYYKGGMMPNDIWDHSMGQHCFERTIDPIQYPTQVRG